MITWPYFAGFLDGDGWITSWKAKNCRTTQWAFGVTQLERERAAMMEIRSFLTEQGLTVQWLDRISTGLLKTQTPMVDIRVRHQESLIIGLKAMVPHLLIKRTKAEECLADLLDKRVKRGIDLPPVAPCGKCFWTSDEISALMEMHGQGLWNLAIARKLGRTVNSVARKLSKLGVVR